MSDIVERLRTDNEGCGTRMDDALDEIERLRAEVAVLKGDAEPVAWIIDRDPIFTPTRLPDSWKW